MVLNCTNCNLRQSNGTESDYEVGKEDAFRLRLIYKQFISENDVLEEYHKAQTELGFERISDNNRADHTA